jgi:hypothetical protein
MVREMLRLVERVRAHPNGFYKLELQGGRPGKVCLHYWRDGPTSASDIHSHRWSFDSDVLLGALLETRYRVAATGDGERLVEHVYSSPGDGTTFGLEPRGDVWVVKSEVVGRRAGNRYRVGANVLHQVLPSITPTCTLVRQAPVTEAARVLRRSPAALDQTSEILDASALSDLVDEVEALLIVRAAGI